MTSRARLVTIPFSHYCDKARWALDRAGVAFDEEGHAPVFHYLGVRRAGARRTVPVLVHEGRVLTDSTDICKHADALAPAGRKLYPAEPALREEAERLEDLFDEKLGPATRRIAYFHVLADRGQAIAFIRTGAPAWEGLVLRAAAPLVFGLLARGLKVDPAGVERSRASLDKVLAEVEGLLADGRRFLVGDRFTVADLAFASLAAPMAAPPEYGFPLPLDSAPPALRAEVEAFRARPAGGFALRMYREHRK